MTSLDGPASSGTSLSAPESSVRISGISDAVFGRPFRDVLRMSPRDDDGPATASRLGPRGSPAESIGRFDCLDDDSSVAVGGGPGVP